MKQGSGLFWECRSCDGPRRLWIQICAERGDLGWGEMLPCGHASGPHKPNDSLHGPSLMPDRRPNICQCVDSFVHEDFSYGWCCNLHTSKCIFCLKACALHIHLWSFTASHLSNIVLLGPSADTTLNHIAVNILNTSPSVGWLAGPFPSLACFVSFGVVFQGLIRCHSIKSTFGLGESVTMAAMWKVESPMVLTQSALIKTAHSAWRRTVPHCTAQPEKFHTKSMTATDASQMKWKRICIAKEGKKKRRSHKGLLLIWS